MTADARSTSASPAGPDVGGNRFAWDTRRISWTASLQGPWRHAAISPVFLGWLMEEVTKVGRVLDLGCGTGKLTFALAPHAAEVVGLDRDAEAIQKATRRAEAGGIANIRFAVADVEAVEYDDARWGRRPDVLTAHLCMADALIERAGRALAPGSHFAAVAVRMNQWKETGVPSKFAYTEDSLTRGLVDAGFDIVHGRVEEEVLVFRSPEEAEGVLLGGGNAPKRWGLNPRREEGLRAHLSGGGKEITRKGHLLFLARKTG